MPVTQHRHVPREIQVPVQVPVQVPRTVQVPRHIDVPVDQPYEAHAGRGGGGVQLNGV